MSASETMKFNLRQKPNSRERLMFFVSLGVFAIGFYKACVVESDKAVSSIQIELDKAVAERDALLRSNQSKKTTDKNAEKRHQLALNWIGKKRDIDVSSDALLQGAREEGILLVRFSFPEYQDKKSYWFKPVALTLAGNLTDLGRYLENSEHLPVSLVIEQLVLEPNADFADEITLHIIGGFYAAK